MEQKLYNALFKFMELQTKDCVWYYDTPKQRFRWSPESIWLINPKTEEWVIELGKSGKLWWYWGLYVNFQRYFNMERPDFEKFIKIWMEDVLNRGVSTTNAVFTFKREGMEDVLNRGVSTTEWGPPHRGSRVEDVLNRGISTTTVVNEAASDLVEDVLNRGVSTTLPMPARGTNVVEDVLNRGKTKQ